jgi:hypothetical protein
MADNETIKNLFYFFPQLGGNARQGPIAAVFESLLLGREKMLCVKKKPRAKIALRVRCYVMNHGEQRESNPLNPRPKNGLH